MTYPGRKNSLSRRPPKTTPKRRPRPRPVSYTHLCADFPDQLIAVRKDSPLILGYGDGCNFLASDVTAIIRHTRKVGYMEDGEVAVLTRDGIQCYNHLMQPIEKKVSQVDWEIDAAEKGGYEHFMFKEIMEQPEALRRCIFPRIKDNQVYFEDFGLSEDYSRSMLYLPTMPTW